MSREVPTVTAAFALLAFLGLLGLAGCAGGAEAAGAVAEGQDARVIAQLAEIAPRDSDIEDSVDSASEASSAGAPGAGERTVTATECWKPSENMIDDETFRVLCRVHFEEAEAKRYRDMICIGNVTEDPVTEYCTRWAYYSEMPRYEDQAGYRAS
ncbi:hypothetical protein ACR5KS_08815 [Leucobacter sp. W1153]|uniref:hypothetical protein n=1 Tax=Leucobacter sp. W1153 TaxID=3439064 RepID=UPI003F3EB2C5